MKTAIDLMICVGSVLMAYNIYSYFRFSRDVRHRGDWNREHTLFRIPIVLLVLFLAGYVTVGLFGRPDAVMAGVMLGGSVFVYVMLEIIRRTFEQIRENERLEAKLNAAEQASKAKTFFLSNMSHDIRTPLNAIIGYTTLANGEKTSPEEKSEYLRKIDAASRQLLGIVDDVLEMSRIESGRLELEPTRTDLVSCVQDSADLVRSQLSLKQIDFSVSCDVTHKWVLCDRNLLSRVLMNLLCNAAKFTEENGSVSLRLRELSADGASGSYEICVKDTGIGMSPEFVEHLFTPFERERTSTVSRIQGTGLGMAITKSILDRMNGTVDVRTEKGKGTEFVISVSFPLAEPGEQTRAVPDETLRFDGLRTLLVEDNPINLEIAQMLLTDAGFLVETAENGQIAVDMVRASAPGYYDIILMDIQMPQMDGYTAAGIIRALPDPALAAVPIVAMTANAFREDVRRAEEAGMNGHIAKPLDIPSMMATIKSVLSKPGTAHA